MKIKYFLFFLLTSLLAGCATPYQPAGTTVAGGYSSTRLSEAVFDVRFNGNGFTDPKQAYDFTLLRAAEVALEHNYPYFVLIGHQDKTTTELIQGNSTSYTTGTVNAYGNYGSYNGVTTTYSNDIPVTKPALTIRILCLETRDSLGKQAGQIYDAQQVKDNLRKKYGLDKS